MNIAKKFLYSTLLLACVSFVPNAQAQTEEMSSKPRSVLFKIHEITPVLNAEGLVTNCDFMVTVYNRTNDSLRPSKIDMGWSDEVSNIYLADNEEKAEKKAVNVNTRRSAYNRTPQQEEKKLGDVVTTVDVPALGSYKQVSVKASVKTEKCFMLLDNLEFKISACGIVGKDEETTSRRRNNDISAVSTECANLFEYIDSQNPEYHGEFKNISFSEQEKQIAEDKKHDISDLEDKYNKVVKNFEKAEKIISNIQ